MGEVPDKCQAGACQAGFVRGECRRLDHRIVFRIGAKCGGCVAVIVGVRGRDNWRSVVADVSCGKQSHVARVWGDLQVCRASAGRLSWGLLAPKSISKSGKISHVMLSNRCTVVVSLALTRACTSTRGLQGLLVFRKVREVWRRSIRSCRRVR